MSKWRLKRTKINTKEAAKKLGLSEIALTLMANRGVQSYEEAKKYLTGDINDLFNPYLMKDMKEAVHAVVCGIRNGSKFAVFGDYDVDGVMSVVILAKAIRNNGGETIVYTPNRTSEGYGLNENAVLKLKEQGAEILITCDNGISAIKESALAKELGLKLIILDHHEPQCKKDGSNILPEADAIVNPKQQKCKYLFKSLCAAGITYKFVQMLYDEMNNKWHSKNEDVLFATIATICDMVELTGENRLLVKEGLKCAPHVENLGFNALVTRTGINLNGITPYQIGFIIGPCINAAGRIDSAQIAIDLFLSQNSDVAESIAQKLVELNDQRKKMTLMAADKLIAQVENSPLKNDKIFVLYDIEIHESVAGIVAGRIKEHFCHPSIVLTKAEGCVKGSARSIKGYNIFLELSKIKELFQRFGGHSQAAGLSLAEENVDILREKINENCQLTDESFVPEIIIDSILELNQINFNLYNEIKALEPFGIGNTSPIFAKKQAQITRLDFIGKEKDIIKFNFTGGFGVSLTGISFNGFSKFVRMVRDGFDKKTADRILKGGAVDLKMDIVFHLEQNDYNGNRTLQLHLVDFRNCIQ